ncbi:MAG: hypothetical protein ABSF83_09180 [Nitrososphaerales archaeon]
MALSKRQGTWFRLSVQERSIVNLALSLKVSFRSSGLVRAIASVMKRLQQVSSRTFGEMLRGARIALELSEAAVSWGNPTARSWRADDHFAAFLGRFWPTARS